MEQTIAFQRLRVGLLALVAAALLLAGFAGGAAAANYTALGDSYAAGPLIPNPLLPLGCLKSSSNYAHRAALLYSFALLLIATFVELSGWGVLVNLLAAGALAFYFYAAVFGYMVHGLKRDTDNQFRRPVRGLEAFMATLIVAEIGGWLVLIAGFLDAQIF